MADRGVRAAAVMGIIPIVVGIAYFVLNESWGTELTIDAAGATMLVAFGISLAFGFYVILKGARDL